MRAHVGEAFTEWISCSAHFAVNSLPLVEGYCHAVAASKWCRHWSWAEFQGHPVLNYATSKSDSTPPLVGSATFCCEDWPRGGHWEWMGHKGALYPTMGKTSQGSSGKGGHWKLAPILSRPRRGRFRWVLHSE